LVRQLVAAGHDVTGMTRREEAAAAIREDGADASVCDVYDAAALEAAVTGASPDVIVHQLTSLPQVFDFNDPDLYTETNRVRTEGTRNLIAAARAAGAKRFVAQSIAFIYLPVGSWVKSEADPLLEDAPGTFGPAVASVHDLERQVTTAEGLDGLVLRYGFFYGPETAYAADGHWASEARKRRLAIVGKGDGITSFIHVDDAAAATVAACERGAPGIYNITDDEPARMDEWVPVYAEVVGAKKPFRVPSLIARIVAGRAAAALARQTRGASNAKAKAELSWEPRYSSWRQGFAEALG
jgi:nucleoside-diphosphate-sugar epimerase